MNPTTKLKLGIQCQERPEGVYRYNRELKPVVVKSINIADPEHYAKLARENPGVELVYRQVPNGPWDNEGDGRRWAEYLYAQVGHIPEITLVEGHNEWIHAPPHNAPEDYEKADRFMVELIDSVHELWGGRVHAVVLNASCGHFNEDIVDFFPRTLAQLQLCEKCLLALHEYDHPDKDMLGDGGHDLCGKFLRNLAGLKAAGYDKVRIAITEFGVDSGVGAPAGSGHIGFKYWGSMAWARYLSARNLSWYLPLLQETESVAWATIFGCGMHGEWGTFDIKDTPVINGIGEIYKNWIPPEDPPELPNGDELMDIKVFDKFGNELGQAAAEEMIALHGLSWEMPVGLSPGDRYYKLIELREKPSASLITTVIDLYGNPVVNPDEVMDRSKPHRALWWPSIDSGVGHPIEIHFSTDHHTQADCGGLNVNGEGGSGMGTGAYHDPYTPGPHHCWARHPQVWSVLVEGQGMLGATDHLHLDMKFQEVVFVNGGPPPPEPEEIIEIARGIKSDTGRAVTLLGDIKEALGEQPPVPPVPPPSPPPPPPPPPESELFDVAFFNNVDLAGPPVYTMKEAPHFWHNWGSGPPTDKSGQPLPGVNPNYISAIWSGTFTFDATKTYRFNIKTDDGARLRIDGNLVLNAWYPQGATLYAVDVPLVAGKHTVRLDWFERAGDATIHFNWV